MGQLLVRNSHETPIKRLKVQAKLHGVSVAEEHRRILAEAHLKVRSRKPTFMEHVIVEGFAIKSETKPGLARQRDIESREIGVLRWLSCSPPMF